MMVVMMMAIVAVLCISCQRHNGTSNDEQSHRDE
jgi:hypothetical protein